MAADLIAYVGRTESALGLLPGYEVKPTKGYIQGWDYQSPYDDEGIGRQPTCFERIKKACDCPSLLVIKHKFLPPACFFLDVLWMF